MQIGIGDFWVLFCIHIQIKLDKMLMSDLKVEMKASLPKKGSCPFCTKHFNGLKIHFHTCFDKYYNTQFYRIMSDDYFDSSSDSDDSDLNDSNLSITYEPDWFLDIKNSVIGKKFSILHLNIN